MATQKQETETHLRQIFQNYWLMLLNWKWSAFTIFFLIVTGATLFAFIAKPIFSSKATIWIESDPNILPFEEVVQFETIGSDSLQSYFRLFESRALITDTINTLKLYENPKFVQDFKEDENIPDSSGPAFMEFLIEKFLKKISVRQIQRSSLVEVQFNDSDASFASQTLNSFIDAYIQMNIRMKFLPTEQAANFLGTQIDRVRAEIEESQRKLQEYGEEKNIVALNSSETTYVENLGSVNTALTEAQIERTEKQAYYNGIKDAVLGDIPEAMTNTLIQGLRAEYSRLNREYVKKLENLRPEYPEMVRLKAELDNARDDLQTETENLKRTAYSEYQAALKKENSLLQMFNKLKAEAYNLNSSYVIYSSLKNEVENKTTLLDTLIKRQSEMNVSADLKDLGSSNIWIVDRASVPLEPSYPKKRKFVLYGLLIGLGSGIGLAFGLEYLNNAVKTSKDVTKATGLPVLGVVLSFNPEKPRLGIGREVQNLKSILKNKKEDPKKKAIKSGRGEIFSPLSETSSDPIKIELIAQRLPDSVQAENFQSIRTTIALASPPNRIKSILFTSPLAGEGKTSTISNLAFTISKTGKQVVVVDSDLRKPRLSRVFGVKAKDGLSTFLSAHMELTDLVRITDYPNLYIVSSGPIPPNPADLLSSQKMDQLAAFLAKNFDYALFDAPPILAVSDTIAMGPMVDTTILIARAEHTPLHALRQAKNKLDYHKLKCFGVILNDVSEKSPDGYYQNQYYQHYKS